MIVPNKRRPNPRIVRSLRAILNLNQMRNKRKLRPLLRLKRALELKLNKSGLWNELKETGLKVRGQVAEQARLIS